MTLNGSMDGRAFEVFIEHFLVPNLWEGAVVVMDNLPAHKLGTIEPLIQAAGASLLNLSPYSPDFNPIELWWSQLKSFLRQFSPSTTKMVEILLATALDLVNPKHFKSWFTSCCYCTLYSWNLLYSLESKQNPIEREVFKQKLSEYLRITKKTPELLQVW